MHDLVTLTEIAKRLEVTPNQVFMWHCRRERNGFPEAVGHHHPTGARRTKGIGRPGKVWRWPEVKAWHDIYTPDRGGAPLGNTNAMGREMDDG